ncbi:sulfite exporter TauE/SafE family protein [Dyella jejuensis]|uniref:Probable membrane transporter protein n=1 Tax=Dyella jejuensis TaxID=1432009 RepID=A0ABW8JKT4_9GAMM
MSIGQLVLLAAIGVVVGIINAIAGAGSLITFPALIAFGLNPLVANVTNCVGVTAGNFSATAAFRHELRGQWPALRRMLLATALGSLAGGILLLTLPSKIFNFIAPLLVAIGSVMTLLQPWLVKRIQARRAQANAHAHGASFQVFIFLIALYGGYFGSGIGLLFFAVLSIWFADRGAHQIDGMKSVLQGLSNGCAGLLFCFIAPVHWPAAIVLSLSGLLGGPLGVVLARRVPAKPLRMGIGITGLAAAVLIAIRIA